MWGNLIQAFLFWLMHFIIFYFVTGAMFSSLQAQTFVISFTMGLLMGFVNFRNGGEGVWPSIFAHGGSNFAAFTALTLI